MLDHQGEHCSALRHERLVIDGHFHSGPVCAKFLRGLHPVFLANSGFKTYIIVAASNPFTGCGKIIPALEF